MPGLNKSRDELPWLYYPRSNSVRVINSHFGGGGSGFDPESAWGLFDGLDDRGYSDDLTTAFSTTADFTATVHFRQSNAASGIEHLLAWADGTNSFTVGFDATQFGARVRNSSVNYDKSKAWTYDGAIHTFQATWDVSASTLVAYLDGVSFGLSGSTPVNPSAGSARFVLGARQTLTPNFLDGSLFYVSLHDRILTSDELTFERSGGVSGTDPVSYLARYLFGDGSGTEVLDSSGNGYGITLQSIDEGTFWNP